MSTSATTRMFSCVVYLSLVGLFATLASMWVLSHEVGGRALLWITWLSVLGAFVALPTSIVVIRRCTETDLPYRS